MAKVVRVRVTLELDVEYPDDKSDEDIVYDLQEHHCPGTGEVGRKIEDTIEDANARSVCWACGWNGESKVLSINGVPVESEQS